MNRIGHIIDRVREGLSLAGRSARHAAYPPLHRRLEAPDLARRALQVLCALIVLSVTWAIGMALPTLAQATGESTQSFDYLAKGVLNVVQYIGDAMFKRIDGPAEALFYVAATFQGAIYFLQIMYERRRGREDHVAYFINRMIRFMIFVAIIGGLLRTAEYWTAAITDGLLQAASVMTGGTGFQGGWGSSTPIGPGAIVSQGWDVVWQGYEQASGLAEAAVEETGGGESPSGEEGGGMMGSITESYNALKETVTGVTDTLTGILNLLTSPDLWIIMIALIGTLLSFVGIAIQIIFIESVYAITTGMMPLFLALAALPGLHGVATGYLKFWLQVVLRMFMLYIVIGVVLYFPVYMAQILPDSFSMGEGAFRALVGTMPPEVYDNPDIAWEAGKQRLMASVSIAALSAAMFMLVRFLPRTFSEVVSSNISFDWLRDLIDDDD
jgi:hypothetical protein